MKDLFDRWGMIIIVFLVVQKNKNPTHNKNTCVVSIKLEIDIKKSAVTSPCLLDKKGEGVCLIVKQKRLEISISIYNDVLILIMYLPIWQLCLPQRRLHIP